MIIAPLTIEVSGPGVDLTSQPDGVSIQMADPVSDLAYAQNGVTLTYDLSGAGTTRLAFEVMEFGDERHYPKGSYTGRNKKPRIVCGSNYYYLTKAFYEKENRQNGIILGLNATKPAI
jgi:hypothetical protein